MSSNQADSATRLLPMTTTIPKPESSPSITEGSGMTPPPKLFALAKASKSTDPVPAEPATIPNTRRPEVGIGLSELAKIDRDPFANALPVASNAKKLELPSILI